MARHTDFKTAFEQLEKLLKKSGASRQTQADRYIILITDGRYDPNDTKCFEDDERKMFTGIVDSLQNRKGKWPVYFVGIGKPFYEEYEACKQLKVDVPLLERMAQALPLPDTLADGSERPIFSNTRRRSKNLVTIISDNDEYNREQLQNHLEMILRGSLPVAVAPPTNSKVELPQADPRRMEIDVELESPKTTEALAKALKLFLKTSHHDELFPLVPGTIQAQDSSLVHTLVVDSAKLRGQILGPDPKRAFVPESWGLEVEDHNIILKRVNLKMRYNWSVYIDSCYFDTVATPRSWELRMRNRHEPLKYRLIIQVRAVHPCGGELTNERLRVIVNDEDEWLLEKPKRLQRPWSRTLDKTTIKDTCNVYSWRKEIAHQEIFARRVGRPVRVRIILEDLFDYQIQLDPVVPFNGIPVDTLAEGR